MDKPENIFKHDYYFINSKRDNYEYYYIINTYNITNVTIYKYIIIIYNRIIQ